MRPLTLLALSACTASSLQNDVGDDAAGSGRAADHVRVVSWNIESVGSPASSQYQSARAVLQRLDADVVTLTEVEGDLDESWLEDLADELGYDHVRVGYDIGFGEDRGAILSRIALTHAAIYDATDLSGDSWAKDLTRSIPRVTIDTPVPLTIATSHMKAGTWEDEQLFRRAVDGERLAQAAVTGISGYDPAQHAVVVTGDFNAELIDPDGPSVWTSQPWGLPSSYELGSDLVQRLSTGGIDGHPFVPLEQIGLADSGARQTDGRWWTRPASRRRLDYVFASPAANLVGAEVFNCSLDGNGVGLEKAGSPLSGSTCTDAADHLPVFADFDVGEASGPVEPTPVPGEPTPAPGTPSLVLNEIHADPDLSLGDANCDGSAHYTEDEFVELVNVGSSPVDLGGMVIEDSASVRHSFPAGSTLAPGHAIVVYGGGEPSCADVQAQVASTGSLGLNNGGDTVVLRTSDGSELVRATYGSEGGQNVSLVRDPELSNQSGWTPHDTFGSSHSAGTFADGTPFGGSTPPEDTGSVPPEDTGSVPPEDTGSPATVGGVFLHEVLADPGASDGDTNCDGLVGVSDDEMVELYNPTAQPVALGGSTLADGASIRHVFASGTVIGAGDFLVVYGGGSPSCAGVAAVTASTGSLGLSNAGDSVTFAAPDGTVLDVLIWGSEGGQDTALTRDPQLDPAGSWVLHTDLSDASSSPGEAATGGAPTGSPVLVLNEILADPGLVDGDSNCDGSAHTTADEFVELLNSGTAPVDLDGYTLSDAAALRHSFGPQLLQPGERFVVYGGGVPSCGIPATTASSGALGLSNGGDTVTLVAPDGSTVDAHSWSQSPSDAAMVRQPEGDPGSVWSDHTAVDGTPFSPGSASN